MGAAAGVVGLAISPLDVPFVFSLLYSTLGVLRPRASPITKVPDTPIRGRRGPLAVFIPELDLQAGDTAGIWQRDHESIAAAALLESSGESLETPELRPGTDGPWVASRA